MDPEQDGEPVESEIENEDERLVVLEIDGELDLHSFQPRDVLSVVEEYLLAARARGLREVRVVHGKGKGVQRAAVRAFLSRSPFVESFGDATQGGWGATRVVLRPQGAGEDESTQL